MAASRRGAGPRLDVLTDRADLLSPSLAGSAIYALRPMFHLMLENVLLFERSFDGIGRSRDTLYTLSPGFRGGWNVGDAQIVTGAAMPITWGGAAQTPACFSIFRTSCRSGRNDARLYKRSEIKHPDL